MANRPHAPSKPLQAPASPEGPENPEIASGAQRTQQSTVVGEPRPSLVMPPSLACAFF